MSVFVGIPIKNCAFWFARFLHELDNLTDVSRVVFSYGESGDPTLDILMQWLVETEHKVEIYQEPRNMKARSAAQIGAIYRDFQELVAEGNETHVLLIDADVMKLPKNLIQKLIKYDKDIIAPYVWVKDHVPPKFYDNYGFRVNGCRFHPFDPPMNNNELLKLDSVGTCLLIKRRPFLEIPYQDVWSHINFCRDARVKGYEVWADPKTRIEHIDLERFGIFHYPTDPLDVPPLIKNDGIMVYSLEKEMIDTFVWGLEPPIERIEWVKPAEIKHNVPS